jgi:hypothetical protein
MSAIINQINPVTFELQTYAPQDLTSIPSEVVSSDWGGTSSYAECTIISANGNFQITDQNFNPVFLTGYPSSVQFKISYDIDH